MEKVRDILLKQITKINKAYLNYQNNPYKPRTAHKLRVNIHKLRALLNFLKPIIDEKVYHILNDSLRETAQIYGKVRDIDVLIDVCGKIALRKPELSEHYKDLFNYLGKERRKEMRRTFNKTHVSLVENTLALCEKEVQKLEFDRDDWKTFAEKRMHKQMEKLENRLEKSDQENYDFVNKTRSDAKKVRYAAAEFGPVMKNKQKKVRKNAAAIQDKLGNQKNLHVSFDLMVEFEKKANEKSLKTLFHNLREELQLEATD